MLERYAWRFCKACSRVTRGMGVWSATFRPAASGATRIACQLTFSLLLSWAATLPAYALQVTDDRGVTVTFAQTPQRIVSMLPSLTESVCALGQCQRLVGVDRYSNYPDSVQRLPKLGGGMDPDIEAIVTLRPDVVLVAISSRSSGRLESLGIKVIALEANSHTDVRRVLQKLGALLSVPDEQGASRLWRIIDSGVMAAAQSLSTQAKNTRVYFEVSRGPYAAGESSFIGETLNRLGVKNVVPSSFGPFPKLNPEFVVRANPDLIMLGNDSGLAINTKDFFYPGWSAIKAVKNQRICLFGASDSEVLVRPGPRIAEAARLMAKCIEKYADPSGQVKVQ